MAENWWETWVSAVAPYAILLSRFIDGGMSADEFEVVFMRLYLEDSTEWSPELFDVLDSFFGDVDEYCGDERLRQQVDGLDATALRKRAEETFGRLRDLAG